IIMTHEEYRNFRLYYGVNNSKFFKVKDTKKEITE
ncbi:unnamed protein product, partial [marine sediment metagenome]